jgi:hypothetical protein
VPFAHNQSSVDTIAPLFKLSALRSGQAENSNISTPYERSPNDVHSMLKISWVSPVSCGSASHNQYHPTSEHGPCSILLSRQIRSSPVWAWLDW